MSNLLEKASIVLTPTAYSDGTLHSIKPIQTLGSELVTNGDYATDSDWNKGDGWTINGGAANCDGTQTATTNFFQSNVISDQSRTYRVEFTLSNYSAGTVKSKISNDAQGVNRSANGTYVDILSGMSNNSLNFTANSDFIGSIDSVSVKEVIDADFDFTRSTTGSATGIGSRENSSGNIESVAADLPRIDYLGGTAHILLEPESTNTATYSNDFTQGDIFNSSGNPGTTNAVLTSQQITAPDGTNNGWLLKDNNNGGTGPTGLQYFSTRVNSGNFNTISIFVKKALSNDFIILENAGYDADRSGRSYFNISNGSLANIYANHTAKIEDYGDGWYRCSITFQTTTDIQGAIYVRLASSSNTVNITRDGTSGVYIFGIQCEAHASREFATSYIPTSGDQDGVTRSADAANNSGSSDLINSTEGVLYAEIASLNNSPSQPVFISLSNAATRANTVEIGFNNGTNGCRFRIREASATIFTKGQAISDITQFTKIAIKYKSGDIKCFINGSEIQADTTSFSFTSPLSELNFDRGDGADNFLFGKVKSVAVFKEALTDAQLTALTS